MSTQHTPFAERGDRLPVLFVGHGNPMNAIEDNAFSRAWAAAGRALPRPEAILCISAHWETRGAKVTAMPQPKTIYDFYGFPPELYQQRYPAPGSPALADLIQETLGRPRVEADLAWGLDHGAWSVLVRLFPEADIPVVQLSLDRTQPPAFHYELGQALRPLRRRGVLIIGSGNIVHNLRLACWDDAAPYDWALAFDATIGRLIAAGDHRPIVAYGQLGKNAQLSIPTNEHFLPLLYVLGAAEAGEPASFFADQVAMCAISMRSVRVG